MAKTIKSQNVQTLPARAFAEWRERMAYTPTDAARELGVPAKQWSVWESGTEAAPRMAALAMAALALGMEPYAVIDDKP